MGGLYLVVQMSHAMVWVRVRGEAGFVVEDTVVDASVDTDDAYFLVFIS